MFFIVPCYKQEGTLSEQTTNGSATVLTLMGLSVTTASAVKL